MNKAVPHRLLLELVYQRAVRFFFRWNHHGGS